MAALRQLLSPLRGLRFRLAITHGLRRGLNSFAAPRLERALRLRCRPTRILAVALLAVICGRLSATAQQTTFEFDPAHTSVTFTLGAVLHTVEGAFRLKHGALQFEAATGKLNGEIVVDATSGESGNGARDRKMHKDVLESARYPEISFRPDRVEGNVASQGKSSVKVHGMFRIHGVEREILVPAEVERSGEHWTATVHFTVPYEKWGMKNPSTLFLRVSDSVEIDVSGSGSVVQAKAAQ